MNPIKKLFTGIVLLIIGFYLVFQLNENDLLAMQKTIKATLYDYLPVSLSNIIAYSSGMVIAGFAIYAFCAGFYRVCSFNMYIPTFESKQKGGVFVTDNPAYKNINEVLRYREARLGGMNNEKAADFLKSTAILDTLSSGNYYAGPNTRNTLGYIEGKLGSMNNEKALNYLAKNLK